MEYQSSFMSNFVIFSKDDFQLNNSQASSNSTPTSNIQPCSHTLGLYWVGMESRCSALGGSKALCSGTNGICRVLEQQVNGQDLQSFWLAHLGGANRLAGSALPCCGVMRTLLSVSGVILMGLADTWIPCLQLLREGKCCGNLKLCIDRNRITLLAFQKLPKHFLFLFCYSLSADDFLRCPLLCTWTEAPVYLWEQQAFCLIKFSSYFDTITTHLIFYIYFILIF